MALRLGDFTLHAVDAGRFALDGGALFGLVPKPLWEREMAADPRNRVPLAARCLLVEHGPRRILVDAGIGGRWDQKRRDQYAIREPEELFQGLARLGLAPEEITDLVITHLHFDHAGGLTRDGPRGPELNFPRATHHLQRRHWSWAHHPSARDRGSFRDDLFRALEGSGRLHLLEGEVELLPGLFLLVSEGHTVGMQLVRLLGGGRSLFHCADLIPTRAHLRPAWSMAYDLHPLTLLEEKRMLLAQALEEEALLFFGHDPQVAACRVRAGEAGGAPGLEVLAGEPVEI